MSPIPNQPKKLFVLLAAAAGYDLLVRHGVTQLGGLPLRPIAPVFPALTCPAQATLRTALLPEAHGVTLNGFYDTRIRETAFWEQSSALVSGERIWTAARRHGARVGMYFFQQSLGEDADEIVSPAPIHTHGGGLIMATYQKPEGLLSRKNPVPLWRYWGPLASPKVGYSIEVAIAERLIADDAPDVVFAYLPTLDYDLQRYGVSSPKTRQSVEIFTAQVEGLRLLARVKGYEFLLVGDYAITEVTAEPVYLNRLLAREGLFATREIKGMRYPDFHQSRAFALCDHQVALVYAQPEVAERVKALVAQQPGVARILPPMGEEAFIAEAQAGTWFAYPWWEHSREAPDYATHVDIHNKPGFDPCELFFGKTPFTISLDATRVKGTHGRADAPVALATTLPITSSTFDGLADEIRHFCLRCRE